MNQDKDLLNTLANSFAQDFLKSVWQDCQCLGVKGVGISGSFARGEHSPSRVDINFVIFAEEKTAELLYKIGSLASKLNGKHSSQVNLRPELHPERFACPWGRNENTPDLFFKVAIFNLKERKDARPFGRPGYVVEGHKESCQMYHGHNYFTDLKIRSSNEEVLEGCRSVLSDWQRKIQNAPLAYNLVQDTALFFNEALVWGKLAVQQYAWIQGLKNGLDYSKAKDRQVVLDKIHHKEKLRDFLNLPGKEMEMVTNILDARLRFQEWKSSPEKAQQLFHSSSHLLSYFSQTAQASSPEQRKNP